MPNATRSTRAKGATTTLPDPDPPRNEVAGTRYPRAECSCDAAGTMSAEYHERLLSLESRGATGLQELVEHMELSHDGPEMLPAGEALHWTAYTTFVSQHNWADPAAVTRLIERIEFDLEQLDASEPSEKLWTDNPHHHVRTAADRRYGRMMAEVEGALGREFLLRFDETVGERLVQYGSLEVVLRLDETVAKQLEHRLANMRADLLSVIGQPVEAAS